MAQSYSRKPRKQETAPEQAFVEGLLRGIGQIIVWGYRQLTKGGGGDKKRASHAELARLEEHWADVELYVLQEATLATAISEADKILDSAMKVLGYSGDTMADRLRSAESRFGSELYQRIWDAHKLRNALAHEVGARVSAAQAQAAVATFRQALYQLGVLS